MTKPTSNTSLTVRGSFIFTSSNPVYAVQFIDTFYHFMNSVVAKFYDRIVLLTPIQYGDVEQYFYRDIIFR